MKNMVSLGRVAGPSPQTQRSPPSLENRTKYGDVITISARKMAEGIVNKKYTITDLISKHIQRLADTNEKINTVAVPMFESAIKLAQSYDQHLDERLAKGFVPPLYGVPIVVKETFDIRDAPTTGGIKRSGTLKQAPHTSVLVTKLIEAGAIVLAKTNVGQLLLLNECGNPVYGRTNNPWDVHRSPGGSAEAAAVAVGGAPIGLSSDVRGSIRLSASACGVMGLKPTTGRFTPKGHYGWATALRRQFSTPGVIARNVDDISLTTDILQAGPTGDAQIPRTLFRDYKEVDIKKLKIGYYTHNLDMKVSSSVQRAVMQAVEALKAAGAEVIEWPIPGRITIDRIEAGLMFADKGASLKKAIANSPLDPAIRDVLTPLYSGLFTKQFINASVRLMRQNALIQHFDAFGSNLTSDYWDFLKVQEEITDEFLAGMVTSQLDAVIGPADALPAARNDSSSALYAATHHSRLYNVLGMPAGAMAVTTVKEDDGPVDRNFNDLSHRVAQITDIASVGLPVGVQVAAKHWREDIVLAVMSELEKAFENNTDYPMNTQNYPMEIYTNAQDEFFEAKEEWIWKLKRAE